MSHYSLIQSILRKNVTLPKDTVYLREKYHITLGYSLFYRKMSYYPWIQSVVEKKCHITDGYSLFSARIFGRYCSVSPSGHIRDCFVNEMFF